MNQPTRFVSLGSHLGGNFFGLETNRCTMMMLLMPTTGENAPVEVFREFPSLFVERVA